MSLELPFGLKVLNPVPVDSKYLSNLDVPYTGITQVNTEIPIGIRHIGLTVNINGVEYWYRDGINNVDLIIKSSPLDITGYTASTEIRLQGIESDIFELQVFSANTENNFDSIESDIVYLSGYTASKQDALTAGGGISSSELTSNKVALDLSNYVAPAGIEITITGSTTDFKFNDGSSVKRGIEYGGNYSATFSNRSLVDKQYVDGLLSGLSVKNSVIAATNGINIPVGTGTTLSLTGGTIDNIILLNGDRVLVKDQSNAVQNGIYTYNTSTSLLTRAIDFDETVEVTSGSFVTVISGDTNGQTAWIMTSPNPVAVNVDPINWSLFPLPLSFSIENVGTGEGVLSGITYNSIAYLKSLIPSGDIEITSNNNEIIIDSSYDDSAAPLATLTVGGISSGYVLTGKTFSQILQDLLSPILNPTLVAPSITSFSQNLSTTQEIGVSVTPTFTTNFSRGSKNPQYTSLDAFRSGLPTRYEYSGSGNLRTVTSSSLTDTSAATGATTIVSGANTWGVYVKYGAGTQPKNSAGGDFSTPLASGSTSVSNTTITGIYPYFYGKVASGGAIPGDNRPVANNALVTGGTKVVASSTGTITINFNSTSDDYLWFATPSSSTSKTVWYVDGLNNGSIGGGVSAGGNLFPALDTVSVTTVFWSGINYKVYISNYQTEVLVNMELRNS